MQILFLDFDGPIFPEKIHTYPENQGLYSADKCSMLGLHPYVTYWKADPDAIDMLNVLYDVHKYKLVISSSWADDWLHQREHIENVLQANGLVYDLHEMWRTPRDQHTRSEQIAHWLSMNPDVGDRYVILDDVVSGRELSDDTSVAAVGLNPNNVILVDVESGMTRRDYDRINQRMSLRDK